MLHTIENKMVIVSNETKLHRYTNNSCLDAASIFNNLEKRIGCTYLIYLYENLANNEKYVYSSNWGWQDLLIGERLINHCPIFLTAFRFLENKKVGQILVPWHQSPPTNKYERNVCGLRAEFNISNGFGYAAKGHGIRESLAFGGDVKDNSFYRNFISYPNIFYNTLKQMRLIVLLRNQENAVASNILNTMQQSQISNS